MKKKLQVLPVVLSLLLSGIGLAQKQLSTDDFKPHTVYFKLSETHEIPGKIRSFLKKELKNVQFVGLAEVHQSQQLSYFTTGLLGLLSEGCFSNFAMELGPYSAEILQELSSVPGKTASNIQALNRRYGKNEFPKIPLIFADKEEDALFVQEAAHLEYSLWGLDQEFDYSYEMHLDRLYNKITVKTTEITRLYHESKRVLQNAIFKNRINNFPKNCWLKQNETLTEFFALLENDKGAQNYAKALQLSWDIYCMQETNKGGNQQRADYMKMNFENKYSQASKKEKYPKVFVKLGAVHLTRTISPYGVHDMGEYLKEKAVKNGTEFISIRHLIRYKNGEDVIQNDEWKQIATVLRLGRKNRWALIDLRPIRKKIQQGEVTTENDILRYGLQSYDFVLISPDDKNGALNF